MGQKMHSYTHTNIYFNELLKSVDMVILPLSEWQTVGVCVQGAQEESCCLLDSSREIGEEGREGSVDTEGISVAAHLPHPC